MLRGVERRLGTTCALDSMTWSAAFAQVTAVLGPNGAGKTTAVSCAVGLQRPDAGIVRVLGTDPWRSAPDHRARVGLMLQDGGLPGGSTPLRLLRCLAALYDVPGSSRGGPVDDLVARLGIQSFAGTTIRRLSGGQRQRVALAAAVVGHPDVLFLDEPTAGLDPHARLDVWDLMGETSHAGAAVVLTTHSFEEAEHVADRVVIVDRGRVAVDGTLAEVTADDSLEHVFFASTRTAS